MNHLNKVRYYNVIVDINSATDTHPLGQQKVLEGKIVVGITAPRADYQTKTPKSKNTINAAAHKVSFLYLRKGTDNTNVIDGMPLSDLLPQINNGVEKLFFYEDINWNDSFIKCADITEFSGTEQYMLRIAYVDPAEAHCVTRG